MATGPEPTLAQDLVCVCPSRYPPPSHRPSPAFSLCAAWTLTQREQGNYLHPFFLMMFPNTTSALQKRPRHEDFITA